jgi:hypothetical protein
LPRLKDILGPAITEDLQGLWRARNAIVHVRNEQAVAPTDSLRLYESFRWAVIFLSSQHSRPDNSRWASGAG